MSKLNVGDGILKRIVFAEKQLRLDFKGNFTTKNFRKLFKILFLKTICSDIANTYLNTFVQCSVVFE